MAKKHTKFGEGATAEEMRLWSDAEFAEHWGEKCPDYDPYCPCCTAWRIRELERATSPQPGAKDG